MQSQLVFQKSLQNVSMCTCRGKGRRGGDLFFFSMMHAKQEDRGTGWFSCYHAVWRSGDVLLFHCHRDFLIPGIWESNQSSCSSLSNIQLLQQRTLCNTLNTISYLYISFRRLSPNTFWYSAPWRHYCTSSLFHILWCFISHKKHHPSSKYTPY